MSQSLSYHWDKTPDTHPLRRRSLNWLTVCCGFSPQLSDSQAKTSLLKSIAEKISSTHTGKKQRKKTLGIRTHPPGHSSNAPFPIRSHLQHISLLNSPMVESLVSAVPQSNQLPRSSLSRWDFCGTFQISTMSFHPQTPKGPCPSHYAKSTWFISKSHQSLNSCSTAKDSKSKVSSETLGKLITLSLLKKKKKVWTQNSTR